MGRKERMEGGAARLQPGSGTARTAGGRRGVRGKKKSPANRWRG